MTCTSNTRAAVIAISSESAASWPINMIAKLAKRRSLFGTNGRRETRRRAAPRISHIPIETVGYAVFIPRAGAQPIGPFLITDDGLAQLATLLSDPRRGLMTPDLDPLATDPTQDDDLTGQPRGN